LISLVINTSGRLIAYKNCNGFDVINLVSEVITTYMCVFFQLPSLNAQTTQNVQMTRHALIWHVEILAVSFPTPVA
jgi:hypothetical protein